VGKCEPRNTEECVTVCAAEKDGKLRADQGDARQTVKLVKSVVRI